MQGREAFANEAVQSSVRASFATLPLMYLSGSHSHRYCAQRHSDAVDFLRECRADVHAAAAEAVVGKVKRGKGERKKGKRR